MERTDILTIDITEDMMRQARAQQAWLDRMKDGAKTRNAVKDKNIIGSIAHQAAEQVFETCGYPYSSTRLEEYRHGDAYDIAYEDDRIDVKGSKGRLSEQWYYNRRFFVFQAQLDDPKIETITHLLFVEVDLEGLQAHVYGVIPRPAFLDRSTKVSAQESHIGYAGQTIVSRELKPILRYINRA